MVDPLKPESYAERLRWLLERLQSDELQLGEARDLRQEVLRLVGGVEVSCELA